MLEKDIENLIAQYPNDFFPNSGFALKGQQVKLGRCYADIVFADKHNRTVIIEVKRGLLSRDASGQIIEYYGLLKQERPEEIIELILCANTIPHERKIFLENAGIECKELGLSALLNIAKRHNYAFIDGVRQDNKISAVKQETITADASIPNGGRAWIFQANPNRYDILNALSDPELKKQCWQINQHKSEIKKGDIALIWMSGKESGIYAVTEVISDPENLADFPAEEKYWVSDEDRGKKRLKVIIELKTNLVNNPVFRSELKDFLGLKGLSILNFFQGTNFPVKDAEWKIIKSKIQERIDN